MGFIPTSQLTMAYKPALLKAFINLTRAVYQQDEGSVPLPLKNLVGHMASRSAGCQYCVAHTGSNASRSGVEDRKIAAIWEYENSPLFSDAERAALRFAQAGAQVPNMVTDDDVEELKKHFTSFQIVELTSVISVFGFLNRWNDTMATTLEEEPTGFAERALAGAGWAIGKHG
ncbi:MAG: carboxymuconolactone decarboxylase family protein [Alphaproteobacteria bacterium]|nr:carboxymuconolactone decarboxylase family protein [Alphaproteobacteria bacterium]